MSTNNTFNKIVVSKHSHNGSVNEAKFSHNKIRSHCVSVRLNDEELTLLNERRSRHRKGEWLRMAFLHNLPSVIPSINLEAWKTLGEISHKLNRLAAHLDSKSNDSSLSQTELFAVKRQISVKWFTEFGHLNRGDMLTSEQHRCSNEKKKFQS